MADADLPIALRKPRRIAVGAPPETTPTRGGPQTPRRAKRAVRFSDPGPSSGTSGLTPMIQRTYIAMPKRRRASTPCKTAQRRLDNLSPRKTPRADAVPALRTGETAQQCLHQTAEGRIARRIRRNNFRELLNRLEQQKKSKDKEMSQLKAEIKARDQDIYELRNATIIIDTERIWDLERQVAELKQELERRSGDVIGRECSRVYDWALGARECQNDDETTNAFTEEDGDDDYDHFGDMTVLNLAASTPSRAVRSRDPLTPPTTSPMGPATPCWRESPTQAHAAAQTSMKEAGRQQVDEELASLRLEVGRLTTTLDSYRNLGERIGRRIQASIGKGGQGAETSSLEAMEKQMENVVQILADRTATLEKLTSSIAALGFPGDDAGDMIAALASGFRSARLELEYLRPGESTLPLTCHGAEVLDVLLARLRQLAKGAVEDEAAIDEYHATEQSLRQQLDGRVAAMDGLSAEVARAKRLVEEQGIANHRLRHAIDGYVRDMAELEALVERMEDEGGAALAARDAAMVTLEQRLAVALDRAERLQKEVTAAGDVGAALALRDARVLELRAEVDRGRETVADLTADLHAERLHAKTAIQQILDVGNGFLRASGGATDVDVGGGGHGV
ncbi:hypothetical protein XA68_12157 [Ophiocordyceps unilateralis]|uniref:Uncharacterized protein n=1 Tax=Ophiocordyceps unilateralis TaxID=268505 RepID=A0A2A9PMZ0_OPHUN|nr:hypothetical protein XA68_12157 [Ophiocordyceps unilateralis]